MGHRTLFNEPPMVEYLDPVEASEYREKLTYSRYGLTVDEFRESAKRGQFSDDAVADFLMFLLGDD